MSTKQAPRRSARQSASSSAISTPKAASSKSASASTSNLTRRSSARARTTESASLNGDIAVSHPSASPPFWVEVDNSRLPGRVQRLRGGLTAADKGKKKAIDDVQIAERSPSVEIVEKVAARSRDASVGKDERSAQETATTGLAAIPLEERDDAAQQGDESLRTPSPPPSRQLKSPELPSTPPLPPPAVLESSPPRAESSPPVAVSPPRALKSSSPPAPPRAASASTISNSNNHQTPAASRSEVDNNDKHPAPIRLETRSDPESGSEADVEEVARPAAPKRPSPISQGKRKEVSPAVSSSSEGEKYPRVKEKRREASPVKKKQRKAEKAARKDTKKPKGKKRPRRSSSDEDDLEADLNADAFARSTAPTIRKDYAARLQKFKAARLGKGVIKDSDADSSDASSDSDSDSSDSSSSSSSSGAFIVDDEPSPSKKKGKGGASSSSTSNKKNGIGGPRSGPFSSRPSILTSITGRPRLELVEACFEYCRWLLLKIFELNVHGELKDQLWAAREQLQRYADDSRRMVTTSAMRRQFTWYLKHYPNIKRIGLFSSQIKSHRGCAACHRASQVCDAKLFVSGKPYNRKTLMFLDPEEDRALSSDMSTDAENAVEHTKPDDETFTYSTRHPPPRKMHIFYAGSFCVERAMLYHTLTHWEYDLLQKMYRSQEVTILFQERSANQSRVITGDEVEVIANLWKRKLMAELTGTRKRAMDMTKAK